MPNLSWPMATTIIFAGMPAFVFSVAVVCAYPGIVLPMLGIACAAWGYRTKQARHAALAERAVAGYPFAAALVAAPLPDLPTVPRRYFR
jgi:hypothetical protein